MQKKLSRVYQLLIVIFALFTVWVYLGATNLADNDMEFSDEALSGKKLFQDYNCSSCHQIYGLGGYLGPDLTDFASKEYKGEDYLNAMLQTGPGQMPIYYFDSGQVRSLYAYLNELYQIDKKMQSMYLK
ncbi:MAG: cytochrome c [Bacteroidetes bacterium]|nr:MAG: cytochrome c [Bacteroidota bacterium]REK05255.1 MAG: cytochrome c [Bacteroidota bacterium]REK32660.1 MAG: cytochrome c [Bacteroidota bacterium]REK48893.1 MAG: cytochrome c [Bacteroidota bacterium]